VTFIQSMQDSVDHHRRLEVDLHGALQGDQFFLMYQPTVDLSTGAFTGVEALFVGTIPIAASCCPTTSSRSRILGPHHSRRGVGFARSVSPRRPVAGPRSPLHGLGQHFGQATRAGPNRDDVREAITMSGFDANELILELTETALMHDSGSTLSRLMLLKALGVRVAIDDFGTGYSSSPTCDSSPSTS